MHALGLRLDAGFALAVLPGMTAKILSSAC
jgi:hypothetical protein